MINNHGLTMKGLKAAAGATKRLTGYYSGFYEELFYDRDTGEVWTVTQYSIGQNTWTVYDDASVVKVCNLSEPVTMQGIADLIRSRIDEIELGD